MHNITDILTIAKEVIDPSLTVNDFRLWMDSSKTDVRVPAGIK